MPHPLPPPTERLSFAHLDPSSTKHCEFLVSLYNSPLYIGVFGKAPISTPEQAAELIRNRFVADFERNGYGKWIVMLKPDPSSSSAEGEIEEGTFIGCMGFSKRDGEFSPSAPDVGFGFLPEYTGKGYATEALRGLIEHGQRELGMDVIFGFTDPDNGPSCKLMARVGMEERGIERMKCFGLEDDRKGKLSRVFVTKGASEDLSIYNIGE
ncbi:GNAT family acetyltransferase, putative [Paecilomyces variotii No. 5]|uniref:GNAT family acetyltransferase, putative n=1 Tax=Byssochlamys spectabilis (strain No. 5 / NBRC 109023) TaxID=1356009 RepID=V5I172_BYSSN|nr:GNAT family acetyltransferase, putative [Paecilomyces variotii No. 5]